MADDHSKEKSVSSPSKLSARFVFDLIIAFVGSNFYWLDAFVLKLTVTFDSPAPSMTLSFLVDFGAFGYFLVTKNQNKDLLFWLAMMLVFFLMIIAILAFGLVQ